jgi:type I restriction enzyme M protein
LSGIFGDVQWSNKEQLSDELLNNLIDHFSQYNLSNSSVSADILGDAYEYLIKHFADLTNKKAGEFYTPRSVVNLMTKIIDPKENESIYDPACGTGGMLIESLEHLKKNNLNHKTLKIYGQESNLTTSAIARINLFLHNAEDFNIFKGDTLRNPGFFESDNLKTFDCVIANPPFSLDNWGSENWTNDPFGRNIAGVPPKGTADMAWVQHMIKSTNNMGRMTVVLPHGVLFRKGGEGEIRKFFIEQDLIETIIGIGPNIFYGTQLSPCILILKKKKEIHKKNKVFFIDAFDQIRIGRAQNYLEYEHVNKIYRLYKDYKNIDNLSKVVSIEDIKKNEYSLNIPLYIRKNIEDNLPSLSSAISDFEKIWKKSLNSEKLFLKTLQKFMS